MVVVVWIVFVRGICIVEMSLWSGQHCVSFVILFIVAAIVREAERLCFPLEKEMVVELILVDVLQVPGPGRIMSDLEHATTSTSRLS